MPIFEQGYQHWQGTLSGHTWRWFTVTRQGVRAQTKGILTRILVLIAWIPALILATFLIFWGLFEKDRLPSWLDFLHAILYSEVSQDPRGYRIAIWTMAYQYFFSIQLIFSMLLVLFIGPALISQDLRFNALPLYFSRPLRRIDYFAGKLGVIGVVLGAVAIVPPVLAWVLGVIFSLDLTVITDTFPVLIASIGGGAAVVVSAGTLMLAISSLSRNSLLIGAIWFGFWSLTGLTAGIMFGFTQEKWCHVVSYSQNLEHIQGAMLNSNSAMEPLDRLYRQQLQQTFRAVEMQRRASERRRMDRPRPDGNRPEDAHQPVVVMEGPGQPSDSDGVPPDFPSPFRGPIYPWYWSAGVLAGLFGISAWILSIRVRTLDRLR
jgi:ABC-2 type transport system permease protein